MAKFINFCKKHECEAKETNFMWYELHSFSKAGMNSDDDLN